MAMHRLFIPPTPFVRRFHRALMVEFIGTFMLVLVICLASMNAGPLAPIAIGFILLTQVFSYGYISGGMFNPSVTCGISLVRLKRGEDAMHIFNGWIQLFTVQVLGGFCAALMGWFLGNENITRMAFPAPRPDETTSMGLGRTFVVELIFTFALVSSVLNCAVSKKYGHAGNHFFGLAIGMTVLAGALSAGPISGAAFNPAVTIALQVVQCMAMTDASHDKRFGSVKWMWLYLIAQLLASYIAAFVFCTVSCEDHSEETESSRAPVGSSGREAKLLQREDDTQPRLVR